MTSVTDQERRLGRPRDRDRDVALLDATVHLLSERGYAGFTVADVAARARASKATVYRRWPSKADLVVAALMARAHEPDTPPDTGSLRGDLVALVEQLAAGLAALGGLVNVLVGQIRSDPAMTAVFRDRLLAPRMRLVERVFAAAERRGEIAPGVDTALVREVIPAVLVFRLTMLGERPDPGIVVRLVDEVVLPAARRPAQSSSA